MFAGREPHPAPPRTAAQPAFSSRNEKSLPITVPLKEKINTPHCASYSFLLTAVKNVSQPTKGLRGATHVSARLFQIQRRNVP